MTLSMMGSRQRHGELTSSIAVSSTHTPNAKEHRQFLNEQLAKVSTILATTENAFNTCVEQCRQLKPTLLHHLQTTGTTSCADGVTDIDGLAALASAIDEKYTSTMKPSLMTPPVIQVIPSPRFQRMPHADDVGYLLILLGEAERAKPAFEAACRSVAQLATQTMHIGSSETETETELDTTPNTVSTKFNGVMSASEAVEEVLSKHEGRFNAVCNLLQTTFICSSVAAAMSVFDHMLTSKDMHVVRVNRHGTGNHGALGVSQTDTFTPGISVHVREAKHGHVGECFLWVAKLNASDAHDADTNSDVINNAILGAIRPQHELETTLHGSVASTLT